ncbi:MAG: hypothetical protein A2076_01955 [Geobacteraceae bacterium GWC2_53_11]|nr:MAG: hypothetical protein A2076_01955 [Geobacteraceae bacterium GWC2_53_11]
MHIEHAGDNEVVITGNIKSVEDSLLIKETINTLVAQGSQNIHLKIKDSLSITSTMIGYLMKLVHQEKVHLFITVGDSRLYSLLEELKLLQQFNVHLTEH